MCISRSTRRGTVVDGPLRTKSTVWSSTACTSSRKRQTVWLSRREIEKVSTTSCEVKSLPSLHCAPWMRLTRSVTSSTHSHEVPATGIQLPSAHRYMNNGGSIRAR